MLTYSKTYRDRIRRKGPLVKASCGLFEATGKTRTEAKENVEKEIAWYLSQSSLPEVRRGPDGSVWVLFAEEGGYGYLISRPDGPRHSGSSHGNLKDRTDAIVCMLTHMADSFPEETWDGFLWGLTEKSIEGIRKEIHYRDKLRTEPQTI